MSGLQLSNLSCGNDGVSAGFMGAINGALGVIGLGGILGNTSQQDSQKALSDANAQLQKETSEWNSAILNQKLNDIILATNINKSIQNAAEAQQNVVNEILGEKIQTNSLMIGVLAILVLFLIFYDIM
jgi:predicted PurR-regulated permease PerM|uniref:Uncharacterized protein n=1 Tax=viral metagenome TaxID=1070528 RepID=A0A6C0KSE0_9ZZZZ